MKLIDAQKKKKRFLLVKIILFISWLSAFGWLVRYEAYPEFFTHKLDGYKSIISKDVLLIDSWMRILVNGSPVGYSYTKMEVEKSDPVNHYKIENALNFTINLGGLNQRISIKTNSVLNNVYQLQKFYFFIKSSGYSLKINGKKIQDEIFKITTTTGDTTQSRKVKIPEDVVIYSPMTEIAMKKLKPGQKLSILTFDPVTMSLANIMFTGVKKEKITIDKKEYETTHISINMKGAVSNLWIDSSTGQPVRQSTPFGWTMEKTTSDLAMKSINNADNKSDILTKLAIRPRGLPVDPDADEIRLKLKGLDLKSFNFESDRQKILSLNETATELMIINGNSKELLKSSEMPDETLSKFLKSTMAVQSDHSKIIKAAKKIIQKIDSNDDKAKAEAIFNWVHKNVKKEITISIPSALDVLHTMKGDCNEHTYLFTALARAAKIPTRITTGLAFTKDRFYYHAWPAVYIDNTWREMDPTWGQTYVDTTHIAIVNGEIGNQFQLFSLMGQLNIEVTEVIYDKN
ncbi:MAG: transglutaminase domain-containing protein [Desulfobacterales bacterium]|nr:transglutaminase domain-containing protein [Desulfobacterales bacterium]